MIVLEEKPAAALLVDFENLVRSVASIDSRRVIMLSLKSLEILLHQLRKQGFRVVIARAYAEWSVSKLAGSTRYLNRELNIQPVFVSCVSGKNSADVELITQAAEILYNMKNISYFMLVGGDSDYLPLVRMLIGRGKQVSVASMAGTTNRQLINAVSEANFIEIRALLDEAEAVAEKEPTATFLTPKAFNEQLHTLTERCVIELVRHVKTKNNPWKELRISHLLKRFFPDHFPGLHHAQHKMLVGNLQSIGAVRLEECKTDLIRPYRIVHIIWSNEIVQRALAEIEAQTIEV